MTVLKKAEFLQRKKMNKAILLKKLDDNNLVYTMTDRELAVEITGFGIVKITLDSDYWLFYNFFRMLDNVADIKL